MLRQDFPLKDLNTFGIECTARYYFELTDVRDPAELQDTIRRHRTLVLGGGSNILFRNSRFDGLVLHNKLKGINVVEEDKNSIIVEVKAGEVWDDFVAYCVENKYYGVENLSLIPGTAGAAPVQNIGAYGVELKDVFYQLNAIHLSTGEQKTFDKNSCRFGYRDSVFKSHYPDTYLITAVQLKLSKQKKLNLSYPGLQEYKDEITDIRQVRNAVIKIRKEKLPDPEITGNAGSFFKNPVISREKLNQLISKYPDIPHYPFGDRWKVAAGWLIEKAGWKGKRTGNAGVHDKQALILVNYGGSTGEEILNLAAQIEKDVYRLSGIRLEREVRVY